MANYELFYATNRRYEGSDRWKPTGYGAIFSSDGQENLRFGKLTLNADDNIVNGYLQEQGDYGLGNGIGLADYLAGIVHEAKIQAYEERIPDDSTDGEIKLGSRDMFDDLKTIMAQFSDVLVYVHGFNVSWSDAVGSALALQIRLDSSPVRDDKQKVTVVLFTWPSNGSAIPFYDYKSDRAESADSGRALARGFLKLRDYLMEISRRDRNPCKQDIHLLCHSMGNFALQKALPRIIEFAGGKGLPRLFEHIFMCAPDVDADCFEDGKAMARLPEVCRSVTVYYNSDDKAMFVSDYTKGNPERLGCDGVSRPAVLNNKIHVVDCTPIVRGEGFVEHSYYLNGFVNDDIRLSTDDIPLDDGLREIRKRGGWPNLWVMKRQ